MADKLLKFEVVASDHQGLSVEASSIVVRTPEGELGFLANHIAMIAALVPQVARYKDESGKEGHVFVSGGFVEVNNNHVIIITPASETAEQIDFERAHRAEERARERLLRKNDPDIDVARAQAALARALARQKMQQYV